MNKYIDYQIQNMLKMSEVFIQSCKLAAVEDDGEISKEEARMLKRIEKATKRFEKELAKIDSIKLSK